LPRTLNAPEAQARPDLPIRRGKPQRAGFGPGRAGFGSSADEPAKAPAEIVQGLPEARRVASAFATAYATWRSDESPDAAAARLVRYATPTSPPS